MASLRDTARAMSQENVEIVRAVIDARNRDIEEWLTFFHRRRRVTG
jgi:hypothetical protein